MHSLGIFIILSCTVAYVLTAAAIYPPEPKPAKFACQPGCYIGDLGKVLPYNEPYSRKGRCEQFTCQPDNYTQLVTCGVVAVDPNCCATFNKELKYPDCCQPTIVCDTTPETPIASCGNDQ